MLTRCSYCHPKTGRHKCWFCRLKPESITTSLESTADHREGPDHIWKYYSDRQSSSPPGGETDLLPRAVRHKTGLLWWLLWGSWFALLLLWYWWIKWALSNWNGLFLSLKFAAQTRHEAFVGMHPVSVSGMILGDKDMMSNHFLKERMGAALVSWRYPQLADAVGHFFCCLNLRAFCLHGCIMPHSRWLLPPKQSPKNTIFPPGDFVLSLCR